MTYEILIAGDWVGSVSGDAYERLDPADTRQVVARAPRLSAEEASRAVEAAASAFPSWRTAGHIPRGSVLAAVARRLAEKREEVARDITRENGKTLAEALIEVDFAVGCLEFYAGLAREEIGVVVPDRRAGSRAWYEREPLGAVAIITPWNDPLATPVRKIAPALLAGDTVVFKPASETPIAAHHLSRLLVEAGLPAGVFNVVTGRSNVVGPVLVESDAIKAISFTGSTVVGLVLGKATGGTTKRLQTEMGGKNAAFVCADADQELAVATISGSACGQAGQRCTATSRVVVDRAIADDFIDRLTSVMREMRVGPGLEEGVQMGPLATQEQFESVLAAIDRARSEGATVVGGDRLDDEDRRHGYFVRPAVITSVRPGMHVWREEIFGPAVAVQVVDSFEEGVAAVNDSRYGLTSSIFTSSLDLAHRFVEEAETGQVAVNLPSGGWDYHMPFGGFKESGSPFKENGTEALRFYTRTKTVAMRFR